MASWSALFETDMRLPDLPEGKCVNHPTRVSVRKHLCYECLVKWEQGVLKYEAFIEGSLADEQNNDDTKWRGGNFIRDEDMAKHNDRE